MKEMLSFLWTSAPELMSLLGIVGILVFIAVKFTLFFSEFKQMGVCLTRVEDRLDRLEKKVDMIIDYLIKMAAQRPEGK